MESKIFLKHIEQKYLPPEKYKTCNLILRTTVKTSTWELDLADLESGLTYHGVVTEKQLEETAAELEVCKQLHREECLRALTKDDVEHFIYLIDRNEGENVFKLIKSSGFDIVYLDMELSGGPKPTDLLRDLIEMMREKDRFLEDPQRPPLANPKRTAEYKELSEKYVLEMRINDNYHRMVRRKVKSLYLEKNIKIRQLRRKLREAKTQIA